MRIIFILAILFCFARLGAFFIPFCLFTLLVQVFVPAVVWVRLSFSWSIFYRAGLVVINTFSLCLAWKVLFLFQFWRITLQDYYYYYNRLYIILYYTLYYCNNYCKIIISLDWHLHFSVTEEVHCLLPFHTHVPFNR